MGQAPALRTNRILQTVICTWYDETEQPTIHRGFQLWSPTATALILLTAAGSACVVFRHSDAEKLKADGKRPTTLHNARLCRSGQTTRRCPRCAFDLEGHKYSVRGAVRSPTGRRLLFARSRCRRWSTNLLVLYATPARSECPAASRTLLTRIHPVTLPTTSVPAFLPTQLREESHRGSRAFTQQRGPARGLIGDAYGATAHAWPQVGRGQARRSRLRRHWKGCSCLSQGAYDLPLAPARNRRFASRSPVDQLYRRSQAR